MTGWQTLFYKEVLRFWKVAFQTVAGAGADRHAVPADFRPCAGVHVKVYDTVSYTAFLVPGLAMMSVLQNAFANSSSSLIMSKVMGNLVFLLLTPLSLHELVCGLRRRVRRARAGRRAGGVCRVGLFHRHLVLWHRCGSSSLPCWAPRCWARWG